MSVLSWQLAASQLMVAFLFGGSLLYSSAVAAFLFKTLPPSEAGVLLRKAFTLFYRWLIATSLISALLLVSIDLGSSVILAVIALITVPLRQQLLAHPVLLVNWSPALSWDPACWAGLSPQS
ncbi:MAG: cell division protein FtsW (lipid II flippase) [Glaciecola sp.]|jgi:cell division protein FtsW (lipid II flippase)|uniref:DUF4149 domain-containing protein n=1 Tax=Congregibacter sp. TaxID=2744308 RepID=UPI0039E66DE0